MPIFGNNGVRDSGMKVQDRVRGSVFVCPDTGYGQSISATVWNPQEFDVHMACAVYKVYIDENGDPKGELLAITEELLIPPNPVPYDFIEYTFDLLTFPQFIGGGEYLLVGWSDSSYCAMGATEIEEPGLWRHDATYNYPNFPVTHMMLELEANILAHIWCTYNIGTPDCTNPDGWEGDIICGDETHGQDPTHKYECQCSAGVCEWVDLGYSPECDIPEDCVDPVGKHGDIICGDPLYGQDRTHQYQCDDGAWIDLGYAQECVGCTNPSGQNGDIICGYAQHGQDPTHQYECVNGSWVDMGYNQACVGGEEPIPWVPIAIGAVAVAAVGIGALLILKKR